MLRPFPTQRLAALLLALSAGTSLRRPPSLHRIVAKRGCLRRSGGASEHRRRSARCGWIRAHRKRMAPTTDIDARILGLASQERTLVPISARDAKDRLALSALDLAAHAALGDAGDGVHAEIAERLAERIRATGDGSSAAPMRVASASDAVVILRLNGERTLGGFYGTPSSDRLSLVLFSVMGDSPIVSRRNFDLSSTLSAWRRGTAWSNSPYSPRNAGDLVDLFHDAGDHFALTSTGLRTANERGESGHYAAARALAEAADAGNGVARYALGDLYPCSHPSGRTSQTRPETARSNSTR